MTATNEFFLWYYGGVNLLGGWIIFLLVAVAAVAWLIYDSASRRIPAIGWRMGAILCAGLLLPTFLLRFSSGETQESLLQFLEIFFYLGVLGGVVPLVVALGYFITYRGLAVCDKGHLYESTLGSCPFCAQAAPAAMPVMQVYQPASASTPPPARPAERAASAPLPARRDTVPAWLVDAESSREYQLFKDATTIGRGSSNDIQITGNTQLSREHALIRENGGRFMLIDRGSALGVKVNGRRLTSSLHLEPNDEIELAGTRLRFVTAKGK